MSKKPLSTIEHLEHAPSDRESEKGSLAEVTVAALDGEGLVKSRFDQLTIREALWVFRRSLVVCFFVFTGRMLEFFEIVMSGAILANPGFIKQFGDPNRAGKIKGVGALDPNWVSAWAVILSAGQIFVFLWISFFTDRFGRKPALLLAWFFIAIAMVCLTLARTPEVWLVGRLFTGMGTGIIAVVAGPYGMEVCATRIRGIVLSAAIFWGAIATLGASLMMNFLTLRDPMNWHLPVYATWGPVGFMAICFLIVPESPWFYARRGNKEKAVKSLKRLYGNIPDYDFDEEYGIIAKTIEHEREAIRRNKATSWTDLFKGTNGKRTFASLVIAASLQLGGYPILYTYSTYTYALVGIKNPFQTNIITASVQCGTVLLMMVTFDKFGRRPFVTWAYSFQALSMFLLGCLSFIPLTSPSRVPAITFIACMWAFCGTISGNSQIIYITELPSAYLRLKTGVLAQGLNSALGIAANFASPPMLLALGLKAGFVFFAVATPIAALLWVFLPETKWRSASEIDELYERKIPAWRWAKTRTNAEEQVEQAIQQSKAEGETQAAAEANASDDSTSR
ncbi:hypothetical protein CcaverHIS002_0208970 [Cutaneotrichosporon cavernicola]|uniref:Major facilitator superfamily (MFS) profile domain-containing protein n=1 Tax=Cutaneotrichosporon cavernicola TaxID=279322 RepID=A0AA48IE69_9TREE|nr:uncharacterized protein CcaverHIS019_0208980 [Cutaneotrichosporon cavernicola]BEI81737.1 hypothetical protein CcaverHIS002_0208970 [Cutaneotrichosporon cavernicola]BEI89536.1 hypothetical protein CcaverHIS019_0208980 [Cutaneotrichosporon cavernicola]BEI97309.1 hypothetical protein CcaverHIS631_0208980 [Cutaneotrichosporon cavernicola]BEJ05083.1 hypothetical protein CcaverHIS641_0209000 [Cutaneotrichosporon cavernicola]